MTRRRTLAALVLAAGALLAACGGGGSGDGAFDDAVAEVRAAVEDGDAERATTALDGLALQALAAHDEGTIDDDELSEVAELIESSKGLVGEIVPEAATTTTSVYEDTAEGEGDAVEDDESWEEWDDDDEEKGEGKGKKDD
jgi:hypothetical protein